MAFISQQSDFFESSIESLIASNLRAQIEESKQQEDPKALLIALSKSLEEVVTALSSKDKLPEDKIVHPNFNSLSSNNGSSYNAQAPSNATMQEAIGKLMGLLSQLEGEIAQWGNQKAQLDSDVGKALMLEMQSQIKQAQKDLSKVLSSEKKQHFWSTFEKVAEVVAGTLVGVVAILSGQPELAAIVIVMTVLAVSGGMNKTTDGLSELLMKAGLSSNAAHILASAIIVVASIVITALTCGGGAATAIETAANAGVNTAENTAENSVEMVDMLSDGQGAAQEQTQSFLQRVQNFFGRVGNWVKNNNVFNKLPKNINFGIVAGSMAIGNTNFAQYFTTAVLAHMKEGKEKNGLTILLETVVSLMAAIAGMGAGISVAAAGPSYQISMTANLIKGLVIGQTAVGVGQAAGQFASADVEINLANSTKEMQIVQTTLDLLRTLIGMNNNQTQSDAKNLGSELRAKAEGIATLTADVVKEGSALANVLRS